MHWTIDSDTHATRELDLTHRDVEMARKGGAPRNRVLRKFWSPCPSVTRGTTLAEHLLQTGVATDHAGPRRRHHPYAPAAVGALSGPVTRSRAFRTKDASRSKAIPSGQ